MNWHIRAHETGKCEACGADIQWCDSCGCAIPPRGDNFGKVVRKMMEGRRSSIEVDGDTERDNKLAEADMAKDGNP